MPSEKEEEKAVWAIADLHLSKGIVGKTMDVFGKNWHRHDEKIEKAWKESIKQEDLVLLPGDISWAMQLEEVKDDLEWLDSLPGTKVMLRGNHDYWWTSLKKIAEILPPSLHIVQNNAFHWGDLAIAGSRLWDSWEYHFSNYIEYKPIDEYQHVNLQPDASTPDQREKIFLRELGRLKLSLQAMGPSVKKRIAMTHYPPIGVDLRDSRASELFEKFNVDKVVFGHIHAVKHDFDPLFGVKKGAEHSTEYILVAADYLDFKPKRIL